MLKITHKTRIMHNAVDLLTKKIDIIQKGNWKENVIMHDTRILAEKEPSPYFGCREKQLSTTASNLSKNSSSKLDGSPAKILIRRN